MAGSWSGIPPTTEIIIPTGATSGERIEIMGNSITAYYADDQVAWAGTVEPTASLASYSDDPPATRLASAIFNGQLRLSFTGDLSSFLSSAVLDCESADGSVTIELIDASDNTGFLNVTRTANSRAAVLPKGATWQTPSYNANWAASTLFGTQTGMTPLRFRVDGEDNLIIGGCFVAGATAPASNIFALPSIYRPAGQFVLPLGKNAAGTITWTAAYISAPAGNLNTNTQLGSTVTAGATYAIPMTTVPLGNLP